MRIWSLHPRYLDAKGLVAVWRETLLARAVLLGQTKGYTHHPQLLRFRLADEPVRLIDAYLWEVREEAAARGYNFDATKIGPERASGAQVPVTEGQLRYEWALLLGKVAARNPEWRQRLDGAGIYEDDRPAPHPLFFVVPGPVEAWEKVK